MACCVYCLCYLQRLRATRRGTAMQNNRPQVLEVELADRRQPLRNWCLRALGLAIAAEGDEAEWVEQAVGWLNRELGRVLYVQGGLKISALMRRLQLEKLHMAIVLDEFGGTLGLVTLEDVIEELVGEIWDEHDEATEDFRRQSDGSWIVLGSAGVDDLYERLGLPEDEDIDSNTVNGLVQEKTCHLPKVGDRFTLGEYDGVVTRTAKRRVTEVRLTPAEKPEPKKEEDEKPHFNRLTNK